MTPAPTALIENAFRITVLESVASPLSSIRNIFSSNSGVPWPWLLARHYKAIECTYVIVGRIQNMDHLRGVDQNFFEHVLAVTEVKVRLTGLLQNSYNLLNLFDCYIVISEFPCHHAPFQYRDVGPPFSHSVTLTLTSAWWTACAKSWKNMVFRRV